VTEGKEEMKEVTDIDCLCCAEREIVGDEMKCPYEKDGFCLKEEKKQLELFE